MVGSTDATLSRSISGMHWASGPAFAISRNHVHVASLPVMSRSFQLGSKGQIGAEQESNLGQSRIDASSCCPAAFGGVAGAAGRLSGVGQDGIRRAGKGIGAGGYVITVCLGEVGYQERQARQSCEGLNFVCDYLGGDV